MERSQGSEGPPEREPPPQVMPSSQALPRPPADRLHQAVLILATILASWLAMQAVHELGHVVLANWTGGKVKQVVLHPLTISRTDLAWNPAPLWVVWGGPICGVLLPIVLWLLAAFIRVPGVYLLRFFAGFCLIANGCYLFGGSFEGVGDCGEILAHGGALWQLWLFAALTVPTGLFLWHGQGPHFGLGAGQGRVSRTATYVMVGVLVVLVFQGWMIGGK